MCIFCRDEDFIGSEESKEPSREWYDRVTPVQRERYDGNIDESMAKIARGIEKAFTINKG